MLMDSMLDSGVPFPGPRASSWGLLRPLPVYDWYSEGALKLLFEAVRSVHCGVERALHVGLRKKRKVGSG